MTLNLPLGYDNFKEIIDKKLDFVDKSLFIKEILDDRSTQVAVITRPRRFGKTLEFVHVPSFFGGGSERPVHKRIICRSEDRRRWAMSTCVIKANIR